MTSQLLDLTQLTGRLFRFDDAALADLLQARPDLVHPAPGDFTGLAVRAQSDMSLRHCLQRLDAGALSVLSTVAAGEELHSSAPHAEPSDVGELIPSAGHSLGPVLLRLEALGLILREGDHGAIGVPANLPSVLAGLGVASAEITLTPPEPMRSTAAASLVRNASLAAIADLLGDAGDLLAALQQTPATTLRTGGVGMRELRRLTVARSGEPRPDDAQIGETGWLLELLVAAALLELDVDADQWVPTSSARRWRRAPRHRRHQLLVAGWLLAPRSPLLLRGPHPTARIAPALTPERQRGDAPALRDRILRTAAALAGDPGTPADLYALDLPDDVEPEQNALSGALVDRMRWDRPVLLARIHPVLPAMVREAERLGLLAVGTLSDAGRALASETGDPDSAENTQADRLAAMAAQVGAALPSQVDRIHLQSDLTAVAVGALEPGVEAGLEALASKETRGGVPTFRFTADSLRRGLSGGWTVDQIRSFLAQHSLAEIPSSLQTLVEDAARTWRGVTIGSAASWLLEPDAERRDALLEHPRLQHLGLRAVTSEVLVCDVDADVLARALAAVDVDSHHQVIARPRTQTAGASLEAQLADTAEAWVLAASPWQQSPVRTLSAQQADPHLVDRAISALRSAGADSGTGSSDPGSVGGSDVTGLLRTAVRSRQPVLLRRVDSEGREHTHSGLPTGLNAGRVRLRGLDGEGESVLLVHRITAVRMLQDNQHRPAMEGGRG